MDESSFFYEDNVNSYFNDGFRKIDFMLVCTNDAIATIEENFKIRTFISNLEEMGLEFENEEGQSCPHLMFFKVHCARHILVHYAKMFCVNLVHENPYYVPEQPPKFKCLQNALTKPNPDSSIYHRAPIAVSGEQPPGITESECIIIMQILLNQAKFGDNDEEHGIEKLLQEKVFIAAYPLHDTGTEWNEDGPLGHRQLLVKYWGNMKSCFKIQPIQLVEKYYGPQVAFYFAFLGFYTRMLAPMALAGVLVFVIGIFMVEEEKQILSEEVCDSDIILCPPCEHYQYCDYVLLRDSCIYAKITYWLDNWLNILFAIIMSLWATLVVIFWKRRQKRYQLKWDLNNIETDTSLRNQYQRKAKSYRQSSVTGLFEPHISNRKKYGLFVLTYSISFLLVLVAFGAVICVVSYRLAIIRVSYISDDKHFKMMAELIASITGAFLSATFIILFDIIYEKILYMLTELELPRTQWEFDNSYVLKLFAVEFANNYGPLFYLAFLKGRMYTFPGDKKQWRDLAGLRGDVCNPVGCMVDLGIQLFTILLAKNFQRNVISLLIPIVRGWWKRRKYKRKNPGELPRWEEDFYLASPKYSYLVEEYMEMVLMYGFVTFFVAAFPLAPLFLFINNIIEIRLDAIKLTRYYQRPVAKRQPGLGAWLHILDILTHFGILTNVTNYKAFVIAFTSDFIPRMVYQYEYGTSMRGYINSTLSEFEVSDYSNPNVKADLNVTVCYYRGKRYPPNDPNEYRLNRKYWIEITFMLAFVIIFEHVVNIMNGILVRVVPKIPKDVRRKVAFEKHLMKQARIDILNKKMKTEHGKISTVRKIKLPAGRKRRTNVRRVLSNV